MGEEKDQAGLGKVIYSVDEKRDESQADNKAERAAREDVEEADRESFPASDSPGFSGGSTTNQK